MERFRIDILDENNWLIQDTLNGTDACPLDGITNVLKGLIKLLNKYYNLYEDLKNQQQPMVLTTHISEEDFKKIEELFKIYCDVDE